MGDHLPKIAFFHVEAFPAIDREQTPPAAVLAGIRQLHSLTKRADGTLLGKKLSCSSCTVSTVCESCVIMKASKLKLLDLDTHTEGEIQDEQEVEFVATVTENENTEDGSSEAEQEDE